LIDMAQLARWLAEAGGSDDIAARAASSNTALEVLEIARGANIDIAARIADRAAREAARTLTGSGIDLDVVIFDRSGLPVATSQVITT
jgi:cobalt-precorrin-5B (C1)-methyltransferase